MDGKDEGVPSIDEKTLLEVKNLIVKIGCCHKRISRIHFWKIDVAWWNCLWTLPILITGFLWVFPCWFFWRRYMSCLFKAVDRRLKKPIKEQAPYLSSGSLYTLAEASIHLLSRKKDRATYLEWASNRNTQDLMEKERLAEEKRRLSLEGGSQT